MSHTLHADVHEAGLQDGCPRCAEHAEHPLRDLDSTMIRSLLEIATDQKGGTRSETEAKAVAKVRNALQRAGQIAELAPDILELYLLERWHLPTKIKGGHDEFGNEVMRHHYDDNREDANGDN